MQPAILGNTLGSPLAMSQPSGLPLTGMVHPVMAAPGLSQLPNVPQPPYLTPSGCPPMKTTSIVIPGVFGNPGPNRINQAPSCAAQATTCASQPIGSTNPPAYLMNSLPEIPPPCEAAPALCTENTTAQPYQTAQSVPVYGLDPVAEIPPPQMVAPWLFLPHASRPPVSGYPQAGAGQAMPRMPLAPMMPQAPLNPMMPQAPLPPQQPQQPPQARQPQQPPQQQPQQPPQPPPQQPQQKGPTAQMDDGGLDDQTIRSLNDRLNNLTSDETRADAAMDLFKILEKNPSLANNPVYKPYIDAFMEKIMNDYSPLVRAGGELVLQLGLVSSPSEGLKSRMDSLDKSNTGGLTGENNIISSLMGQIKTNTLAQNMSNRPRPGQAQQGAPGQQAPGAGQQNPTNPAAGDASAQNNQNTMLGGLPGGVGEAMQGQQGQTDPAALKNAVPQAQNPQQGGVQPGQSQQMPQQLPQGQGNQQPGAQPQAPQSQSSQQGGPQQGPPYGQPASGAAQPFDPMAAQQAMQALSPQALQPSAQGQQFSQPPQSPQHAMAQPGARQSAGMPSWFLPPGTGATPNFPAQSVGGNPAIKNSAMMNSAMMNPGSRLNMMSAPQQSQMAFAGSGMNPYAGQRLNIQEGYR